MEADALEQQLVKCWNVKYIAESSHLSCCMLRFKKTRLYNAVLLQGNKAGLRRLKLKIEDPPRRKHTGHTMHVHSASDPCNVVPDVLLSRANPLSENPDDRVSMLAANTLQLNGFCPHSFLSIRSINNRRSSSSVQCSVFGRGSTG